MYSHAYRYRATASSLVVIVQCRSVISTRITWLNTSILWLLRLVNGCTEFRYRTTYVVRNMAEKTCT
jgi:hypothetical protein